MYQKEILETKQKKGSEVAWRAEIGDRIRS